MIFSRDTLASGPGNARNSTGLTFTCRKVKVGKGEKANLSLTKISKISSFKARERRLAFFLGQEGRTSGKINRPQEKIE